MSYINTAFNQEVQADFTVARIHDTNYFVLNMVDLGTKYGIRCRVEDRSARTMNLMLETRWFLEFGSPAAFSADPEFTRCVISYFIKFHKLSLNPRPARASKKNGVVERQNDLFKSIL